MKKLNLKSKIFLATMFFASAGMMISTLTRQPEADATLLNKFEAGRIMDDEVMAKYDSMTEAEIQRFLKSKNPCNNTNLELAKKYTKVKYHIKNGKFVCMAEEDFGGESAAKIIADAARDYKINPQVLIVLLEKEQSLITDTWPNNIQLRSATGFGCPDTAECDKKYYGLKNQVRHAAALFRDVLDGGYTNFPLGINYINYHPNTSCGKSEVEIKNLATSALYRYTPYQPNIASLKAGLGQGDSCSAYGNRNFFNYFNKWFGNTKLSEKVQNKNNNELASSEKGEQVIDDGIYEIRSRLMPKMALDIAGASKVDGANLQLWEANKSLAQQFEIKFDEAQKHYMIYNVGSGLPIQMAEKKRLGNINQGKLSRLNCVQNWIIKEIQGGYYEIISGCSGGLRLDVDERLGGRSTPNIFAYRKAENDSQHWKFNLIRKTNNKSETPKKPQINKPKEAPKEIPKEAPKTENKKPETKKPDSTNSQSGAGTSNSSLPNKDRPIADGEYEIQSKLGRAMMLDVEWGRTENRVKIQLWEKDNTPAQHFTVKYQPSKKAYVITNVKSGRAMDVAGAGRADGTQIWQWDTNGTCAQDWKIVPAEDGYFKLISLCSGKVLDVSGARTAPGTKIQIWTDNGTGAQRWKFLKK